jgi:hypothetical protein
MQTRCARFPVAGPVFGARCSALGVGPAPVPGTRSQVPDSRYPIPDTRYLAPVFEKLAHGVCMMQDARWRIGVGGVVLRCSVQTIHGRGGGAVGKAIRQYGNRAMMRVGDLGGSPNAFIIIGIAPLRRDRIPAIREAR